MASVYKTVYLPNSLAACIESLAEEYDTSFNNVVVSMIRFCLEHNS